MNTYIFFLFFIPKPRNIFTWIFHCLACVTVRKKWYTFCKVGWGILSSPILIGLIRRNEGLPGKLYFVGPLQLRRLVFRIVFDAVIYSQLVWGIFHLLVNLFNIWNMCCFIWWPPHLFPPPHNPWGLSHRSLRIYRP